MEPPYPQPPGKPPKPLFGDHENFEDADAGEPVHPLPKAGFRRAPPSGPVTREAEYGAIQSRIAVGEKAADSSNTRVFHPWYRVAAAVALLLTGLAAFWLLRESGRQVLVAGASGPRQYVLPDQSVVYLKANSRLSLGGDWDAGGSREIWLEGEAYFSVRKQRQAGAPVKFVVHTPDLDVEVLGTRFNVSQQPQRTRVVLQEGAVQLTLHQPQPRRVQMRPGHLVEYWSGKGQLVQKQVDPKPYVAWKLAQWVLDGQTLREIAALVEETYGLKLAFADPSVAGLRLTGKLPTGDVTLLLEALEAAHGVQSERRDSVITLYRRQ